MIPFKQQSAVALGAAQYADLLEQGEKLEITNNTYDIPLLENISTNTLGLSLFYKDEPEDATPHIKNVLFNGSTLPIETTFTILTRYENQTCSHFRVYSSKKSEKISREEDCILVGQFELEHDANLPKHSEIHVTMRQTNLGVLEANAYEPVTNNCANVTFEIAS